MSPLPVVTGGHRFRVGERNVAGLKDIFRGSRVKPIAEARRAAIRFHPGGSRPARPDDDGHTRGTGGFARHTFGEAGRPEPQKFDTMVRPGGDRI